MKPRIALLILIVLLAACSSAPAAPIAVEPTLSPSPITPTATATASPLPPTETLVPSPTPLPGRLVLQLQSLGKDIPWLPLNEAARPVAHYIGFNTLRPPFDSPTVRQAFAYAIDRTVITEMARKYQYSNAEPATTLTPPQTLGWDLYNAAGLGFDPEAARELLAEAGYSDPAAFPAIKIVVSSYGETAPGARFNMASAMADMWREHLGITVQVEAIAGRGYGNRLRSDLPELFWLGWTADINDPDNFLREIFRSSSQYNYGQFSDAEFDELVDRAARSKIPAQRRVLYIQAERLLCETDAALIPLFHTK